jgi:hypothetical protein
MAQCVMSKNSLGSTMTSLALDHLEVESPILSSGPL